MEGFEQLGRQELRASQAWRVRCSSKGSGVLTFVLLLRCGAAQAHQAQPTCPVLSKEVSLVVVFHAKGLAPPSALLSVSPHPLYKYATL